MYNICLGVVSKLLSFGKKVRNPIHFLSDIFCSIFVPLFSKQNLKNFEQTLHIITLCHKRTDI